MGKMKQYPRYNVLSLRVTDEELAQIRTAIGRRRTRQEFLLAAVMEKVIQTRQEAVDERLRGLGS